LQKAKHHTFLLLIIHIKLLNKNCYLLLKWIKKEMMMEMVMKMMKKVPKRRLIIKNWFCVLCKQNIVWLKKHVVSLTINLMMMKMRIGIYTGQTQAYNRKEFRKCSLIKELTTFQGCKPWLINIIWVETWKECNVFFQMNMIFFLKLGFYHLNKMISRCSSQKRKQKLL